MAVVPVFGFPRTRIASSFGVTNGLAMARWRTSRAAES